MSDQPVIILVRHGDYAQIPDAPSAFQPYPLTDDGKAQAAAGAAELAAMLVEQDWQLHPVIHSSSLLRAWQTSSIFMDHFDSITELQETSLLAERAVGSVANLKVAEIERLLDLDPRYDSPPAGWKSDSHYCLPFPGAESLMQAGQRVADYISGALTQWQPGQAMVFVGHGASIRHAACCLGAMDLAAVHAHSMYHARPVALQRQADGSWTTIAGTWKRRQHTERPD